MFDGLLKMDERNVFVCFTVRFSTTFLESPLHQLFTGVGGAIKNN